MSVSDVVTLKARYDDVYHGITTSLTHQVIPFQSFIDSISNSAHRSRMKIFIAVGAMDINCSSNVRDNGIHAILDRLDFFNDHYSTNNLIKVVPGPVDPFVCSMKALALQKKWADEHNAFVHTHSCENIDRVTLCKDMYKMTPIEFMDKANFLDHRTLLAHQTYSTSKDLDILQMNKCNIIHNPLANALLGSGMPDVIKILKMGIPMAISTDGSSTADHQNLLAAGRLASQYQRVFHHDSSCLSAQHILEMITIEPALMLGINSGSLEVGKDADITLFSLCFPNMVPSTVHNVIENLVWSSNGNEISHVIANGSLVLDDHNPTFLDSGQLLSDASRIAEIFHDEYHRRTTI